MRTLMITGPGGSGRTTIAAATALTAAREGTRTLLLSTDRTDTPGAVLGTPPPARRPPASPRTSPPGAPTPPAAFREDLTAFQDRAAGVLDLLGASRLDPEEVTPLPGAEELAVLRALRAAALSDAHDLLVVDLPPTPQALALLALPEELRRYLRRLLPPERQAARALRPVLGRLAGVPMPADWLYETAARWDVELAAVEAVLGDRNTAVRLVAEPGPAGTDALRTARLGLALRALPVESVVANRVLPEEDTPGSWLAGPVAQQRKALDAWREEYGDLLTAPHLGHDPSGADDLTALAVPAPRRGHPARRLAGRRPDRRGRRPRLAHPLAGRRTRGPRPGAARRRTRHRRRPRPPCRAAAVRPAPLHRGRRRPARGRTARTVRTGPRPVAPHPLTARLRRRRAPLRLGAPWARRAPPLTTRTRPRPTPSDGTHPKPPARTPPPPPCQ
ncbi:hypothetical protein GCM10020256_57270 [Streptomyces thermocoprophilus]